MKKKDINTEVSLKSMWWMDKDEDGAGRPFVRAGFSNTAEILELRVYDMLNIMGIDRIIAEEMMYALYRAFNEDKQADDALYEGFLDQYFDYAAWREKHPDKSKVLVKDIIMAKGMNMEAVEWLFDQTVRKFWRSPEYDSRKYRYWNYRELLEQKKEETER